MDRQEPVYETLSASELQEHLSELLERAGRGQVRIVVEQDGSPAAALISAHDLEWLRFFEKQWAERFAFIDAIHARNADVDPEQVEQDVAEVIAEGRRQQREREREVSSRPGA